MNKSTIRNDSPAQKIWQETIDFSTREGIMKEWDKWCKYIREGGGGSWPRDSFESLLDFYDEKILKDEVGTAINTKHEYPTCPVCKGSGEQPWRIVLDNVTHALPEMP